MHPHSWEIPNITKKTVFLKFKSKRTTVSTEGFAASIETSKTMFYKLPAVMISQINQVQIQLDQVVARLAIV